MASDRFSGLNIFLLVVAAASLMFGVYGFMEGSVGESGTPGNRVATTPLDGGFEGSGGEGSAPLANPGEANPRDTDRSNGDRPVDRQAPPPSHNADARLPDVEVISAPTDKGDAVIQGTVKDAAGRPVEGATVTARRSNLDMDPPRFQEDDLERYRADVSDFLTRTARETRSTSTDGKGAFRFSGLDATLAYNLSASSDTAGTGELSRVAAGDTVILLLGAQSQLRGRVIGADGKPITSFEVRAWRQNRQWEATSRNFESADGRFVLPAKPGVVQVEITAKGYSKTEPVDAEVGGDELLFTLEQAAVLSGVVTDKAGAPLPDVTVRLGSDDESNRRGWNQQSGVSARTDSKGRYRFDTLAPKETTLTASLGEMSETKTTALKQGENTLDFSMNVGGVLHIRLSDPEGKPLESDGVWFQMKGNRGWPRPEKLPSREPGLAEYAGLKEGEYTMTVTASGFPAIQQEITVKDGDNEIALQFSTGAMLVGAVTSNSGSKLTGLRALLRKEDDENRWGGWGTGRNARVSDDGTFKLGPAEPGSWLLEVYNGNNWNEPVYSQVVTLIEGENTQNAVVDAGATVIVKVVDEQGNSVSWASVQLQGVKKYNQNTDGSGVATISFVEVGSYTVIANSRGKASPSQFITLRAGDNAINIAVQQPNCCRLTHIYPDTQASRQGLQVNDLVIEYNGEVISSWGGLGQAIRRTKNTDDVVMLVERGGSMLTINLKGGTVGVEGTDGVR
ncbi:MAG: carboxypeptidase regulatory-like domain-containing protein [Planctomycetes bacterium]|nr:carboxypeptidase regulatory-like domain-containing protein [Planctomycetota bacterium]